MRSLQNGPPGPFSFVKNFANKYFIHQIHVFAELMWAVKRPQVDFFINDLQQPFDVTITKFLPYKEHAVYKLAVRHLRHQNTLKIKMSGKNENFVTAESDHWIAIRNIVIDGICADDMLDRSKFRHSMPTTWVHEMLSQGMDIKDEYQPGTEIRLNGSCSFDFSVPFDKEKIFHIWNL